MPKSSEIEGMIARIEAATGPDRELDDAIGKAFGNTIPWRDLTTGTLINQPENMGGNSANQRYVPFYTDSVDAALALVERVLPEWRKSIEEPANGGWRATLIWPGQEVVVRGKVADAPTAPLAILLALLRALSAAKPDAGEPVAWPKWATDQHIAEGILNEAEIIVQLVIHGHEEEIAEHTGAIKSYAGTLLTREQHRAKYATPPLPDREKIIEALTGVMGEMGRSAADPMWADHVEMPKHTLRGWILALRSTIAALGAQP